MIVLSEPLLSPFAQKVQIALAEKTLSAARVQEPTRAPRDRDAMAKGTIRFLAAPR